MNNNLLEVLEKMNPVKRVKFIDSSMKEFGLNGFDNASTNTIVKESGISKGLLFHYFPTKLKLYETLTIYTITLMGDAIEDGVDWENGDIIKRLEKITIIKLSLYKKHPHMLNFYKSLFLNLSIDEIKNKVYKYIPNFHDKVYDYNIDYTLFKKGIDVEKAIRFLQYFLDKYSENYIPLLLNTEKKINLNDIEKDLKEYLQLYSKGFYKEDYKF